MRKIAMLIIAMTMTLCANAQYRYQQTPFHFDKFYVGGSLTSFNMSYNGLDKFNLGVQGEAGYFFADNWLAKASVAYNNNGEGPDYVGLGAGARYYIEQNGLFLGANVNLIHANKNYNDIMPGIEVGYSFFITHTLTIEPAIYYNQSFKKHSDYSTIGLKIGFGIYLND